MPEPFEIVDESEIQYLGVQPILSLQINGVEAQMVAIGVLDLEREAIYKNALADCVKAFRLMREIRG